MTFHYNIMLFPCSHTGHTIWEEGWDDTVKFSNFVCLLNVDKYLKLSKIIA